VPWPFNITTIGHVMEIELGFVGQQEFSHLQVAMLRGQHQSGLAISILGVHIGLCVDHFSYHRHLALPRC
jgi:hypothetical protein